VQGNQGAYGAIRIGTTMLFGQHNWHVEVGSNQIIANGGNNLAGAVGIFNDSANYSVHDNLLCGNQSAEYGGGISHYGNSPCSVIDHNKILLNHSIDEGGGIMIAGEWPTNRVKLSAGAASVKITNNTIAVNRANDDGGGIRFLQAGNL